MDYETFLMLEEGNMELHRLARSEKWVEERNRGVDWRSHTSFLGEHFISIFIQSLWIKYFQKKKKTLYYREWNDELNLDINIYKGVLK